MLNRRSRRAKRIRTAIENREAAFRTKNASGFVERRVTVLDLMPDVGEYHEIAGRGREMCMRRTPHNKVNVVRSDRAGQAGAKLIDHPRPPLYGEHPAGRADAATNRKCIKRFPGAPISPTVTPGRASGSARSPAGDSQCSLSPISCANVLITSSATICWSFSRMRAPCGTTHPLTAQFRAGDAIRKLGDPSRLVGSNPRGGAGHRLLDIGQ